MLLYTRNGRFQANTNQKTKNLKLQLHPYPARHPHIHAGRSLNNLAILYYYEGDKAEAARMMRKALTICETTLGGNHPNSQQVRQSLAVIESELKG